MGFPDEDVDVQNERQYILSTPLDNLFQSNAIVVYRMSKSFSGFRAVDNLTFRVPRVSDVSPWPWLECSGLVNITAKVRFNSHYMLVYWVALIIL